MDACLGYLREVDILMESYVELPLYQDVFEAVEDPKLAEISAKNAEVEEKSLNLLQKALKAIRDIFTKIKEMIHTIFTWIGLSKDEKTAYQQFVKECKENPEFAGMKVTIHDYRKINEEYNKALKEYEQEYSKMRAEEEEARPTLGKKIKEGLSNLAQKAGRIAAGEGSAFTVEAALNYARGCRENAAKVEMMLVFDIGLVDELERQLGKKEIKKFKKKVHQLTSKHAIVRAIAGGRQEQVKTLRDSLQETITSIKEVKKIHMKAGKNNSDVKDLNVGIVKTTARVGKFAAKTGISTLEHRKYAKDAYDRQMKKEKNNIKAAEKAAYKENKRREAQG